MNFSYPRVRHLTERQTQTDYKEVLVQVQYVKGVKIGFSLRDGMSLVLHILQLYRIMSSTIGTSELIPLTHDPKRRHFNDKKTNINSQNTPP